MRVTVLCQVGVHSNEGEQEGETGLGTGRGWDREGNRDWDGKGHSR